MYGHSAEGIDHVNMLVKNENENVVKSIVAVLKSMSAASFKQLLSVLSESCRHARNNQFSSTSTITIDYN